MNRSILTVLFIITFFGCDSNPVTTAGNFTLIPLKIGNSWTYKAEMFDSLGNKIREWTYTNIVTGDTLIDSVKWYFMDSSKYGLLANKNDGIHKLYPGMMGVSTLYYKNPMSTNEIYYLWGTGNNHDSLRIKIELSTINYTNVSYKMYNPALISCDYLRNNVGVVKIELYGYRSNGAPYIGIQSELINHNLK